MELTKEQKEEFTDVMSTELSEEPTIFEIMTVIVRLAKILRWKTGLPKLKSKENDIDGLVLGTDYFFELTNSTPA